MSSHCLWRVSAIQCDRLLPCSNCICRNKQSVCQYENEGSITRRDDGSKSPIQDANAGADQANLESDSAAQLSALGYAKTNGHNSLGIFKKIESHDTDGQTVRHGSGIYHPGYNGLRDKYKSLVRQLPSRPFVEQLLVNFFQNVNWHYSSIDQEIFYENLQKWYSISFAALNRGPQELSGNIRFFPALLFQALALALQFQPPDYDPTLDSLKYVAEMSLDDLANEYSESGMAILSLLGKRDITVVTVQAGFLRTSFLKNSGLITESWHSLGQTIRDAQEMGMHKDLVDRTAKSPEEALQTLWYVELRRRLWVLLQMWDTHMALVLSRPTSIDFTDVKIVLPIDVPFAPNRKGTPPLPRSESDPPTPLTFFLCYCKLLPIMIDILALEKEGSHPKDYTMVEKVHLDIVKAREGLPPCFRIENADTTWDDHPECHWLGATRQLFETESGFMAMSLHKPYIFTNSKSRHEALKAGLKILGAQRQLFKRIRAQHYRMFNLVLSTFDANVLVAAIYILYPTENPQHLADALQHSTWAMERFDTMSERNQLAKAALSVLHAVHFRFKKSIARHSLKPAPIAAPQLASLITLPRRQSAESQMSNPSRDGYASTSQVSDSVSSGGSMASFQPSNAGSLGVSEYSNFSDKPSVNPPIMLPNITPPGPAWDAYGMAVPAEFRPNIDFNAMAPLQPMHDLVFNDLAAMPDDSIPVLPETGHIDFDPNAPWQFDGEFKDDSFWNFMNQYAP